MKIWDYFISFISCEYFISFILGLIASFIGVLASIEYEKRKSKKEKRELQDKQWKTLNKIMHDVQDWAYTLKDNPNLYSILKDIFHRKHSLINYLAMKSLLSIKTKYLK